MPLDGLDYRPEVDLAANVLHLPEHSVELSPSSAVVAHMLAEAAPGPVSTDDLIFGLYGRQEPDWSLSLARVAKHYLARAIQGTGWCVLTYYGCGYALVPEHEAVPAGLVIDHNRRLIFAGGRRIKVSPQLAIIARAMAGGPVTTPDLTRALWGGAEWPRAPEDVVHLYIIRLRKMLHGTGWTIPKNARGRGHVGVYRFVRT